MWLLEHKFPYDDKTFSNATHLPYSNNVKWLLKHNFPHNNETRKKLKKLGYLKCSSKRYSLRRLIFSNKN